MRFRFWLLCIVCAAAIQSFSLDRNAFTFTTYDLSVRVEPEQQRLAVRGKLTLRNDSAVAQKNAVLQISSSLDWRSIQVDGKPVQFVSQVYTSDIDHTGALSEAIVTLPREILPKQSVELEIGYEGVIPLDATRLSRIGVPDEKAGNSDWDQISPAISAVRGIGYVAWYPVATEAANLSDGTSVFETAGKWKAREQDSRMRLNFCTSATATVVMNDRTVPGGSPGATTGDMTSTCSEHSFETLGVTVPTFAVAPFARAEQGPARFYFLPDHQQQANVYMQAARDASAFITDWFGNKPDVIVEIAELPAPGAAPYESGTMLLAPFEPADPKLAQMLLAHELAHSYFYSPRPWIYEGLAHFAQALWREQQAGRPAALDYMSLHRTPLVQAENSAAPDATSSTARSLISTADEDFYRGKAMFVWWMLRDMVGEPALKKAIASYRPEYDKEPSYVQRLLEAQSHRDLEWFFDDWVYRDRGLPDFRIASAPPRQLLNGAYMVAVTVENLGAAGAEVPVTVRMDAGDITKRLEVRGKSSATVRIEVPSSPKEVIVNDGSVPESNTANNSFQIQNADKH